MDFALDAIDTSAAEQGVAIPLKRDDGEPLLNAKGKPVTLTLIGADSPTYTRLSRKHALAAAERNRKMRATGSGITEAMLEEAEVENLELLAACTKGWDGILDSKGEPIKFSTKAVLELYKKYPIAREQADRAIVERKHFIKAS